MNFDTIPEPARDLIARFLDEGSEFSDEDFAALTSLLKNDPAVRDCYFGAVDLDTLLREIASRRDSNELHPLPAPAGAADERSVGKRFPAVLRYSALAACLVAAVLVGFTLTKHRDVAEMGNFAGVRWVGEPREVGSALRSGDTIKLAGGSAEIRFGTGAITRLHGPAAFEVTSNNGGFLHYGQAWTRAETEASQGFTISTQSGVFVDRGTEFLTTAKTDGFSQMQVTSGAVDAAINGFAMSRFEKGSGLGIEPGTTPVMIRIESGDNSEAFSFPTIPPPTADDFADESAGRSSVRLISDDERGRENVPHVESGAPDLMFNGRGQSGNDQPDESFFFPNGATGSFLVDLGSMVTVEKIHTYSWHLSEVDVGKRRRAVQRYTLWALSDGGDPDRTPSVDDSRGWIRIARVDTDAFFGVEEDPHRPAQQACAIRSNGAALGEFRYLLFQVVPTPMTDGIPSRHTFFGEIDVFASESP